MVRPMKHDWSDKYDICHKLHVEEKKTARECLAYFKEALGVDESELPE